MWRARITGRKDRSLVTGAGILIDAKRLLTCAHLVKDCSDLTVSFVQTGRRDLQDLPADISHMGPWQRPGDPGDVAVLELPHEIDLVPARLSLRPLQSSTTVELNAHGFPKDSGLFGSALRLRVTSSHGIGEWLHIEAATGHAEIPRGGFSGSGAYEEISGEVLGMISDASNDQNRRTGRMIPVGTIRRHWEEIDDLLDLPWMPRDERIRLRAIVRDARTDVDLATLVANEFPGTPRPRDLVSPWDAIRFVAEELHADGRVARVVNAVAAHLTDSHTGANLKDWIRHDLRTPPAADTTKADEDAEPSFFISYSRDDAAYVNRLAEHLRSQGLPVWLDVHAKWGSNPIREAHRRISQALGVIVIMSPSAERSDRMIGEVLQAQEHDRRIFPILLRGKVPYFLGATQPFDARDGGMPDESYIRVLRNIHDATAVTGTQGPVSAQPPPAPPPPLPVSLISGTASTRNLVSFLKDGDLEHADIWTTTLLLEAAGRIRNGWMRQVDGGRLPYELLSEVDTLWSRASDGTQGFGAQLSRHAGPAAGTPAGYAGDFFALAEALGWRESRQATPRYGEFVPSGPLPTGFFPTLRNPQLEHYRGWHDHWRQTVMAVHLQLRKWRGRR
ncbi:TIR domain-containing protein [Streptosporangium sp. NPDC051023]|uniref:TIR domain-containing protein n=1 Tax=Streptosporangium sp. NPDC051023 TaxID=3155410 RepID=UPI00344F269C